MPIYDRATVKHASGDTLLWYKTRHMQRLDAEQATQAKNCSGVYLDPFETRSEDWRGMKSSAPHPVGPWILGHGTTTKKGIAILVDGCMMAGLSGQV